MGIADDLEEKEHKISSSIPSATPDPSSTEALCFTPQASGTSLIGACVAPQGSTERLFAGPSCGVQQACRLGNVDRTRSSLSMDHGDKAGIDAGVSKPMTVEAGEVTEKEVERSKSSSRYQQRKQRKRELKISKRPLVATRAKYRILHDGSIERTGTFACGSSSGSSTSASSTTATTRFEKCSASKHVMSKASRTRATTIPRPDTSSASKKSSSLHVGKAAVRVRSDHKQKADLPNNLSVVIDGSNVAFGFTQVISNPKWCLEGILEAIQFFRARGVEVVAFVPRFRINTIWRGHEHYDELMEAMDRGVISTVPPKTDDDLFILSYAISRGAFVVTNDQFNDHQRTPSTLVSLGLDRRELEKFLSDKLVSYTFALGEFLPNPTSAIIKELTQRARVNRKMRQGER
ncbi:unnamed protein product [Ascophyllum nodosum]